MAGFAALLTTGPGPNLKCVALHISSGLRGGPVKANPIQRNRPLAQDGHAQTVIRMMDQAEILIGGCFKPAVAEPRKGPRLPKEGASESYLSRRWRHRFSWRLPKTQ